jgi:hypothetical protein
MNLYRAVDVWERRDTKTLVRYRCFQSLISLRYCVQSADFYRDKKPKYNVEEQFIELLTEQDPAKRGAIIQLLKML